MKKKIIEFSQAEKDMHETLMNGISSAIRSGYMNNLSKTAIYDIATAIKVSIDNHFSYKKIN